MKSKKWFLMLLAALLTCALAAAQAAGYSSVYGQTQAKIRVRKSASTSAEITDNIIKNACVYITSSKKSGSTTFVKIKYRASDGSLQTGWAAQESGGSTYVKILSEKQAKKTYSVSGGNLPSKKVGTFAMGSKASASQSSSSGSSSSLSASTVKDLQTKLKDLGFYSGSITGNIGSRTTAAVKAFQRKYGLSADGIPGTKTLAKLNSVYKSSGSSSSSSSSSSSTSSSSSSSSGTVKVSGTVYNLNWFKAKNNGIFKAIGLYKGYSATLKDLTSGKSLNVRIQSAGNHLDVEPKTAKDTATLCAIYGVSSSSAITSKTCYQRRPMLLTTSAGYKLVCSIYGVPHGDQVITDNNYDGQFCLHFLNSKTHSSNKVDSDHMAAISKAIDMIGSGKVKKLESL